MDAVALTTITVLAVFVGFEVVSKVSSTLHTPLMSVSYTHLTLPTILLV